MQLEMQSAYGFEADIADKSRAACVACAAGLSPLFLGERLPRVRGWDAQKFDLASAKPLVLNLNLD